MQIVEVFLKSVQLKAKIISFPKEKIEEELNCPALVAENGLIPKTFYEDVILQMCVANFMQLTLDIHQHPSLVNNLRSFKDELLEAIYDLNPYLKPENIYVTRTGRLTIEKCPDSVNLTENKVWNDLMPDVLDQTFSKISEEDQINDDFLADFELENPFEDFEYELIPKWWERLKGYVKIKKFSEEDCKTILNGSYPDRASFEATVVVACLEEFEDLYRTIEFYGLTKRVPPPILLHELYMLCTKVNPSLVFPGSSASTSAGRTTKTKPKKQKLFKDIPDSVLLSLADKIKQRVVGQDHAVDKVVEAIKRARVGLKELNSPIGTFIFTGFSGSGKTYLSKVLAEELMGSRDHLIRIDCSEYSADHEYAKLIGCFVPGTKVLLADGSLKSIEDIKVGDKVISHTGQAREVKNIFEYEQDGEMLQIFVANSNVPIITTKGHEILAIRYKSCTKGESNEYRVCKPTCSQKYCVDPPYENYRLEWVPAEELCVNDIVVYPRYKIVGKYPSKIDLVDYLKETKNYKYDDNYVWAQKHVKVPRYILINEDFMRLAGYYVSEGGSDVVNKNINFTFNVKEINYIVEVVKLVRKIFGQDIKIRIEDRSKDGSYRIFISSRIISILMSNLFGKNTYKKQVPGWFINLPNNCLINFLETAIFGDGCTTIPRRVDYSTVSSTLFSQMQLMFRKLGYITYASLEKKSDPKHSDRYRLYIGGNQINRLLDEFTGLNIDLKDLGITNIQRKAWVDDKYVYLQIKDIKPIIYKGKVYDLQVDTDTSYIVGGVGGIAVHNSPAGYIGYEQGGILTNAVAEKPFSIVLFDEVEKASSKVHQLMLQIMDDGILTDNKGNKVSFNDVIVIMTSNIGVSELDRLDKTPGFMSNMITDKRKNIALDEAIKKKFKPEFINRIDEIIHFNMLTTDDYKKIVDLELEKVLKLLISSNKVEVVYDDSVREFLLEKGIDSKYGARPLKRCIKKYFSNPLADEILKGEIKPKDKIKASMEVDKIVFEKINTNKPPFYLSKKKRSACNA